MPRFEVLWVETQSEHATALFEGVSAQPDDLCTSCDEPIIVEEGYAVVADTNDDFWYLCQECSAVFLDPSV